jgi:hypothetical protein
MLNIKLDKLNKREHSWVELGVPIVNRLYCCFVSVMYVFVDMGSGMYNKNKYWSINISFIYSKIVVLMATLVAVLSSLILGSFIFSAWAATAQLI